MGVTKGCEQTGSHFFMRQVYEKNKGIYFYKKGIMSTILGVLSAGTMGCTIYLSYLHKGTASARYGAAAFLAALFMIIGFVLGIWSATEANKFRLFSVLGIIMNVLAFGILSAILFAGAYVN